MNEVDMPAKCRFGRVLEINGLSLACTFSFYLSGMAFLAWFA